MKNVSLNTTDQCYASQLFVHLWQKLLTLQFSQPFMINVKLCMMILLIELYPFITTFSDLDCISHQLQTVLTVNFNFLSD